MRLSLTKAAHADVGGTPCRKSGEGLGHGSPTPYGALEARHYLHSGCRTSGARRCCGIDVPALPGWAEVWLPALRAWVRFAVHCRLSRTLSSTGNRGHGAPTILLPVWQKAQKRRPRSSVRAAGPRLQVAYKPNSVEDDHSSRRRIAAPLKRPTRRFPAVPASRDRNPG